MAGWLLMCAGLGAAYGAMCLLQMVARNKRIRRDREAWLVRYNAERERRWRGSRWYE